MAIPAILIAKQKIGLEAWMRLREEGRDWEWQRGHLFKTAAQPRVAGVSFWVGAGCISFNLLHSRNHEPKPMLQKGFPHPLTIHTVAYPSMFGISSSANPLRKENLPCLPSHVSISLQSPFKFHICKICLFSNTCTQYTQQSQKSSNTAWRKENLLSKPQPQSDVVTHACSPNTQDWGRSTMRLRPAWYWVLGQPGLHSKTLSQKQEGRKETKINNKLINK